MLPSETEHPSVRIQRSAQGATLRIRTGFPKGPLTLPAEEVPDLKGQQRRGDACLAVGLACHGLQPEDAVVQGFGESLPHVYREAEDGEETAPGDWAWKSSCQPPHSPRHL